MHCKTNPWVQTWVKGPWTEERQTEDGSVRWLRWDWQAVAHSSALGSSTRNMRPKDANRRAGLGTKGRKRG